MGLHDLLLLDIRRHQLDGLLSLRGDRNCCGHDDDVWFLVLYEKKFFSVLEMSSLTNEVERSRRRYMGFLMR